MKWFFALGEGCPVFQAYADMAKVAVHTALQHTSLEPHFLYDGGENDFTRWLREREVPIIPCRTFLEKEITTLPADNPELPSTLRGILLRIELPRLAPKIAADERVLYTDSDVFFRGEVVHDLARIDCNYFAVAPEFDRSDYRHMNTGVMWMNLPQLRTVDAEFRTYLSENLPRLQSVAWDQGAYREFFAPNSETPKWEKLPPELNWKPYWGDCADAKIIHFHGPKPFHQGHIDPHFPELKHLAVENYHALCQKWRELLREAK